MISQSARNSRLACLFLATVLSLPTFAAGPVSLQQLIQTGGSLLEGDKKFAAFSFAGDTNAINPAKILVETVALPGGLLGLSFSGDMTVVGGNVDFALFYSLETISGLPLITEIGQSYVPAGGGAGGFVVIGEKVFDQGFFIGNAVAQSSISFSDAMDPDGEAIQGDQLIINPPRSKVWVTKDIILIPLTTNSSAGLSNIVQVFCQNQILVSCPTNRTAGCNEAWSFDAPTATNSCCPSNVTIAVASTVTNQIGTCTFCATRTWRLSDACGNLNTNCSQTICFTRDTTPPVITCATNLNLGCNPLTIPECSLTQVQASDDCGPVSVTCSFTDITNGCSRLRTVIYVATDQCSNRAACTQTISWIQDTNPPVFNICPPDRDLGCNPLNIPGCNLDSVSAQDDCGPVGITCSFVDTTNGCGRVRTITYVAIDSCTNRAVCIQRLTWKVDVTPPVLIGVPTNRNFQCFSDYLALPPAVVTALDDCDGTNVTVSAISGISGSCPSVIEACWIAVDQCSNTTRACVTYTIRDTIPPIIRCPPNISVGCDTNVPPCPMNLAGFIAIGGFASDNCDTNLDYFCFDGPRIGNQIVRTYTVCDDCTNCASCTQIITFVGNTPSTIVCPPDLTVECSNNIPAAAATLAQFLAAGGWVSTTNVLSFTSVTGPFVGSHCDGSLTRTYTIVDLCSNTVSCQQHIFVRDTTPPNIHCGADKEVQCGTDWAFDIPTASDNCDGINLPIALVSTVTNVAEPRCPKIYSVTRTWRATDSCSNSAFCNQTVTIVDTEPPNITCEQDKEELCGIAWAFDIPTAVDKCDLNNVLIQVVSTVTNISIPRCPAIFSVTRTWKASDTCGNSSFCNQTVTIVDIEPPNITCEQDKEVNCGTAWAFDIPTAVDKCDLNNVLIEVVATVTNISQPRCPALYSVTRTWRATDTCGNAAFCNQTVTIVDLEPPNITCGPNKDVQCGTDWAFDIPTAVDKCDLNNVLIEVVSTVTNVSVPRCPSLLSVTRTWRATDTCGNSSFCNQTVTVVDTQPPHIACGPDKQVQCGADWGFDIPTAVDNCDKNNVLIEVVATVTNVSSARCPKLFSVSRIWRATDTCGNSSFCSQVVTIVDTTPPHLACGSDKEVECGADWAFDIPTANDLCDLSNVLVEVVATVTNVAVPQCPRNFSVTRTWRSTDTCGNSSFCNQTVTIIDTTPPNLACAHDQIVECGNPFAFTRPTAVDACGGTNLVIEITSTVTNSASPRCPGLFTVRRTWRALDTCNNEAFCSQTITIVDTMPPTLTCAANQIVECGTSFAFTRPTAVDACDGTNVVIEITSTTTNVALPRCPGLFTVRRTWRAYDTCTNETFCSQTITIADTTPPNLTCAHGEFVECGLTWNFTPPTAVDGCDGTNVAIVIVSTVTNASASRCPDLFSATRTWRATDTCGNAANCSQTIEIVDTTPPELTCAANEIVQCGLPWNFTPPFAVDICDGTNVMIATVSTVTNALCGRTFSATRTWRAWDTCSNSVLCSQRILVADTVPPQITCAPNRVVECGTPWTFGPPSAMDVCDGTNVTITIVSTTTNGLCGATFIALRTWQATDRCGNMAQCSQSIRVVDTEPPTLAGVPANQTLLCLEGVPPPPPVIAFDSCDTNVTVTYSAITNGRCPFIITRCWTAIDDCSNSVQACQSITVLPSPPVVVGPSNQTVCPGNPATLCAAISSTCPTAIQWYREGVAIPGATNACYTIPSVTFADAGQYCIAITGPCHSSTNCARLEVCMAALGDFVWNDLDHDGRQDTGEPGVEGVMVSLSDCLDHLVDTKFTDEFGGYLFTGLTAGTYQVTFTLPPGYKFTTPNVGSDTLDSDANAVTGKTGCYTLAAGETNRTVDAGIYQPAALGDFVWLDSNTNGVQDGTELGVSNVVVKLMDCQGNVLAITNTDADGFYLFTDLAAGSYNVMFNLPPGYGFTGQDQGGDDALDSDANPATGMTACYTLAGGETNRTVDAGLFVLNPCLPVYGPPQTVLHYKLDACVPDSSFSELTPVVTVGCLGGANGSVFLSLDGSHSCNPGYSGVGFCAQASSSATFSAAVYSKAFQFTATLTPASGGYAKLTSLTFYHRSAFVAQFQSGSTANNNRLSKLAVRIKDGASVVYEQTGLDVPTNWTLVTIDLSGANLAANVQKQYVVQLAAYSPIAYAGSSKYIYDVDEVKLNAACGVVDPACFPCVASIAGTVYRDCVVYPGLPHYHDECNHAHGWCCHDGRDHSHCNHRYDYCNHDGKDHSGCRHERGWDTQDGRDHSSCNHAGGRCDRDTRDHSECRHNLNICLHDGGTHYECNHARGYCTGDGRDHSHCNHRYTYCALDGQDHSNCRHERGWCCRDGLDHSTCDHSGDRCDHETRNHASCNHARNICLHDGHDHGDMAHCGHDRNICQWEGHDHSYCDHQSHVCNWDGNDHQSCHHDGGWCNYDGNNHSACDHAHDHCNYQPANTCQDGASGLAGVTVQLKNSTGTVLATRITAADGSYVFTNLAPGTYQVVVVPPTNSIQTVDPDGVLDNKTVVVLSTCQNKQKVDFGYKTVPLCAPATFTLTGSSPTSGMMGNIRTFSAAGVSVKASAFSRTTSGAWTAAYLGSYTHGLGVTDNSEGDGSNDRHVVDNVGQVNYVLFEFTQPVVVNRAYLDYVISDSDITVWIGNFPDPFDNHLTLSDALLGSFALTEDSAASSSGARWALFNSGAVSGNTLVIAAKPGASLDDQFKISMLDLCKPSTPCAAGLRLTAACMNASVVGQPITFSGSVSNSGDTVLTNITVTHSLAGVVLTIPVLAAGQITNYSGSFTPTTCGSFAATITAAGQDTCSGNHVTATVVSTCSLPCPVPCPAATFNLTGNTADSGPAGNTRTFAAGGVSVRASAFSRTTSGAWSTAYLGSYSHGLGVTDNSEGDGSNDRHVVDNIGQVNYVLFEFTQPVVVNRAYLDYVISDSDITVWIGNFPDPFNNHLTLSDALLGSFALTEDSAASGSGARWAMFNGGEVSGNTLVIAAKPGGSLDDQFKISKLDICKPSTPCAPGLRLTTACMSASASGQPITFSGSVSNSGNTTLTNLAVTHSFAGVIKTIAALAAGQAANYSGSFTPTNCGSFTATITVAGKDACNGNQVTATASSTCSVPCPAPCPAATFNLTGSSPDSGPAGNTRTFTAGGVTVRASAFSRTTSGTWTTAYLGSYSHGLGVTDNSEGDGSNDRHVVDNIGQVNYVLFEFKRTVVVNRAYLDYVIDDSDITVWIGTFPDPFNNHLTLSDALLSSFSLSEDNSSSGSGARWALFNGSEVPGNTLVIAAKPGGSLNDQFKIGKLEICAPPGSCPIFIRPSGGACLLEWPAVMSTNFVLESATSLQPPVNWSLVATNPPNPFMITNAPPSGMRFYRIRMQ